jgi:hypothetical protein
MAKHSLVTRRNKDAACRRLRLEGAVMKTNIAWQILGFASFWLVASCATAVSTARNEWLWVVSGASTATTPNTVVERMGPALEPCLRAASDFIATHDRSEAVIRAGLLKVECRFNCKHTSKFVAENCEKTIPVPIPEPTARQSLSTGPVRIRDVAR